MSNRGVSPLTLAEFMVAALDKSAPDGTETIKKKMELADAESWKQEMMAAKEQYMEEILKNIDMQNCWSVSTELLGFSNKLLICSNTDNIRARFIFMAAGEGASTCKIKLLENACLKHQKANTWHLLGHRACKLPSSAANAHDSEQLLQMPVWWLFDITRSFVGHVLIWWGSLFIDYRCSTCNIRGVC